MYLSELDKYQIDTYYKLLQCEVNYIHSAQTFGLEVTNDSNVEDFKVGLILD